MKVGSGIHCINISLCYFKYIQSQSLCKAAIDSVQPCLPSLVCKLIIIIIMNMVTLFRAHFIFQSYICYQTDSGLVACIPTSIQSRLLPNALTIRMHKRTRIYFISHENRLISIYSNRTTKHSIKTVRLNYIRTGFLRFEILMHFHCVCTMIIIYTFLVTIIRPLFDDFMLFISLPHLILLPIFFTIINNFQLN